MEFTEFGRRSASRGRLASARDPGWATESDVTNTLATSWVHFGANILWKSVNFGSLLRMLWLVQLISGHLIGHLIVFPDLPILGAGMIPEANGSSNRLSRFFYTLLAVDNRSVAKVEAILTKGSLENLIGDEPQHLLFPCHLCLLRVLRGSCFHEWLPICTSWPSFQSIHPFHDWAHYLWGPWYTNLCCWYQNSCPVMSPQSSWFLSPSSSSVTNPISTPVFLGVFVTPSGQIGFVPPSAPSRTEQKWNIFDTTNHESPADSPTSAKTPLWIAMICCFNLHRIQVSVRKIPAIWCWWISPLFFHFCEKNTVFAPMIWWLDHVGSPLCYDLLLHCPEFRGSRRIGLLGCTWRRQSGMTQTWIQKYHCHCCYTIIYYHKGSYHHDCSYSDGSYILSVRKKPFISHIMNILT